jgi:hypothetical protein
VIVYAERSVGLNGGCSGIHVIEGKCEIRDIRLIVDPLTLANIAISPSEPEYTVQDGAGSGGTGSIGTEPEEIPPPPPPPHAASINDRDIKEKTLTSVFFMIPVSSLKV